MKNWRKDGGWKCEAGAGHARGMVRAWSARARRLSPTNSGGIGFCGGFDVGVLLGEALAVC